MGVMRMIGHPSCACRHGINCRSVPAERGCGRNAGRQSGRQQPGHHVLGILANQEAVSYQLVHRPHQLVPIHVVGRITLPDRRPRIARRRSGRRRCLERDVLTGSLASVVGPGKRSQPPTRVGGERHRQFRQANAGYVVAVTVSLRHVAWINLTVGQIVFVGRGVDRRIDGRNEGLIKIRPQEPGIANLKSNKRIKGPISHNASD
jgi:hypothetical protein